MDYIMNFIDWIWQMPQNILGICTRSILYNSIYGYYTDEKDNVDNILVSVISKPFSLGKYMFIPPYPDKEDIENVHGHTNQSKILGPLYIPVILIPRILYRIAVNICSAVGIELDRKGFYTETWMM